MTGVKQNITHSIHSISPSVGSYSQRPRLSLIRSSRCSASPAIDSDLGTTRGESLGDADADSVCEGCLGGGELEVDDMAIVDVD